MIIVTDKKPRFSAVEQVLDAQQIAAIETQMHHYPDARAASLDALKIVQKQYGWVNDAQLASISQVLGISVADLEGVATFYNRIYRQPVGRHVIFLCDSVACYLTGYEPLATAIKQHLRIDYGQTTPDQRFTLLPICCLGNCDKGPAVLINDDTHGPVHPDHLEALLGAYQ